MGTNWTAASKISYTGRARWPASGHMGYTGVYKENNRYRAVISIHRKSVHLGMFSTPEDAALAYNKKSREVYGEDGKQNVIKPKKDGE